MDGYVLSFTAVGESISDSEPGMQVCCRVFKGCCLPGCTRVCVCARAREYSVGFKATQPLHLLLIYCQS